MTHAHPHAPRATRHASRPGFSFVELLFAVIILGIGFIMVAGIFPVAIRQSRLTGDETIAAADGRSASAVVQQLVPGFTAGEKAANANATPPNPLLSPVGLPPTDLVDGNYAVNPLGLTVPADTTVSERGKVLSFRDPRLRTDFTNVLWPLVEGNLINPTDPRSAYVLLYRRGASYRNTDLAAAHPYTDAAVKVTRDPAAQLIVIPVQVRNRTLYDTTPGAETRRGGAADAGTLPATLEPIPVQVTLTNDGGGTGVDRVTLAVAGGPLAAQSQYALQAAAEGAFIVISDDGKTDDPTTLENEAGSSNGRIYRLGVAHPEVGPGVYDLAPGYDMAADAENLPAANNATAFLVGRGLKNPAAPYNATDNRYEGYPQDVAVYTTFVAAQ